MVEIIRKFASQQERLLLLQHALLYRHSATFFEYIEKGAAEYKLFEKIADKKINLLQKRENGYKIGGIARE